MPGGRPAAKYSQALRILKIYEMLQHRDRVTISELMGEFEIDRRTVQRDMAVLMEAYAIDDSERNEANEKIFRLTPSAKLETIKLTVSEMIALYMSRNLFRFTEGTELKKAMDAVYDKLQTRLSSKNVGVRENLPKRFYCTAGYPKSYKRRDDVLNEVLTALIRSTAVKISYQPPGKKPYVDTIEPYTLILHNNALYLHCVSDLAGATRTLALERIVRAKRLSDRPVSLPARYDPSKVLGGAFGVAAGATPETVRLLFEEDVAPYVSSRRWHPSMKLKKKTKGRMEMTMTLGVAEDFIHWLVGYGGQLRVESPTDLRREVKRRHREGSKANA